jgi:hypothetical protein
MIIFVDYIRAKQDTLYVDWDVKTVTAGDYTVEFEISIEIYQKFLQKFYDETNPISENNQFKLYIKDEFERRLNLFPDLGLDKDENGNEIAIEVAMVTCAFNNAKIINWLKQRGLAIKNENWDTLDDINDTIRLNLKKDSVLLD